MPDGNKFVRMESTIKLVADNIYTAAAQSSKITKSITNFYDGRVATSLPDFVRLSKAGTELRLHYTDQSLDDARPKTIDAPEYYWSKYVAPYYDVPAPEKWSGVQYPET